MADIASRPAITPRVPWRTVGVAFVIIALLLAAAVVYVGTRPTKLPPPFGVARNGLVAYAADGDIYTGDPTTGTSRAIVVGDEIDRNPMYSRDGTRVAFFRQVPTDTGLFDLAVVGRDGGTVSTLTDTPFRVPAIAEWAPDGSAILVNSDDGRVVRYDATGNLAPVVIAIDARIRGGAFGPPDGGQVLIERDTPAGSGIYLVDADGGGGVTALIETGAATNGGLPTTAAWSPDGRHIAFRMGTVAALEDDVRIYVIRADGTDMVKVDNEPGYWVDGDVVWSPDSTHVAFNRWQFSETAATHQIRPIGVVPITGGPVIGVGPAPVSDGALFDFSPDGTTLMSLPGSLPSMFTWTANAGGTAARPVLIDVDDGEAHELDLNVGSAASWQRLAP